MLRRANGPKSTVVGGAKGVSFEAMAQAAGPGSVGMWGLAQAAGLGSVRGSVGTHTTTDDWLKPQFACRRGSNRLRR